MRLKRFVSCVVLAVAAGSALTIVHRAQQNSTQPLTLTITPSCNLYTGKGGSDQNPGTLSQPFATVQKLVNSLAPGQTGCIRAGTYFEDPTANTSGTAANPITVQSYPGEVAVIDSGTPLFRPVGNSDWELVDAGLGEYRSTTTFPSASPWAYIDGIPNYPNLRVVLVPYKDAGSFRSTTSQYVDSTTPFYVGPGTFYDSTDSRIHVRLAKTAALQYAESRYGTVFVADPADPRNYSILLSQAQATLTVNASYLIFKNITFNQAHWTVTINNNAHDVKFDGIVAWMGYYTIEGNGSNIYNITISNSRIYGDNPYWIFWSDMQTSPSPANRLAGTSIDMRGGTHDWQIFGIHIRGSGVDLLSTNTNENNIFVHHNRIENCGDDGFEIEGTTNIGHVEVYENYIGNCLTGLAPGQSSAAMSGPLYVYRNAIVLLKNMPISRKAGLITWNGGTQYCCSSYMFKQSGSGFATANTHIYQNTLIMLASSSKGINLTPQNPANCKIGNNLALMVNGNVNVQYRTAAGTVVDGDLYFKYNAVDTAYLVSSYDTAPALFAALGVEQHGLGSVPKRGTDPQFAGFALNVVDSTQVFWALQPGSEVFQPADLFLGASSPAKAAGIDLGPYSLPDTRPASAAPDLGAYPFGTPSTDYNKFPFNCTGPAC